jgi:hypothetical protein
LDLRYVVGERIRLTCRWSVIEMGKGVRVGERRQALGKGYGYVEGKIE